MNEPWHLLEPYFEGELTPQEELKLREWLSGDVEHMRVFVREAHLHYDLQRDGAARQKRLALELDSSDFGKEVQNNDQGTSESVPI